MHPTYILRKIKRIRENAKRAAILRWERERAKQQERAEVDPVFMGLRIVRRIVVIDDESRVREAVFYAGDSDRSARKKQLNILRKLDNPA